MSRYIDADELKKVLDDGYTKHFLSSAELVYVDQMIDNEPTADVKPVVRGEWIYKNDNPLIATGYWECSICGIGKLLCEENFCPNCGADMRGENDVRSTD